MSEDRATVPDPAVADWAMADPTGLSRARAQHQTVRRWLRAASPVLIGVILTAAARAHPGPGTADRGLVVSVALAGVAAGFVGAALVTMRSSVRASAAFGALMIASSIALMWTQSAGPGAATALVGVLFIARSLPPRAAVTTAVAAVVVLAAIVAASGHGHGPGIVLLAALAGFTGMVFLAGRLGEANEQAARLLAELEASRATQARASALAERARLAREMHDVLAHSLSGLLLKLEGARMLAIRDPADPRLPGIIDEAHRLAKSGLDEARRAIGALRGDQMPGPDRLPELTARFGRDRGVSCQLTVAGDQRPLGLDARLAVYRVAQEALTNIARHARPDRVEVRLAYLPGTTRLAVEDYTAVPVNARWPDTVGPPDGAGPTSGGGYGLTGMRERAELLGGALRAGPTRTGFLVELDVPA